MESTPGIHATTHRHHRKIYRKKFLLPDVLWAPDGARPDEDGFASNYLIKLALPRGFEPLFPP